MLDSLKQQAVTVGMKKLSSAVRNLPGLVGSKSNNSSDFSWINTKTKHSVNAFQFPLDVAAGVPNLNPEVIFGGLGS